MQNISKTIPRTNTLRDNIAAFFLLAISTTIICWMTNNPINPFDGINLFTFICGSFMTLGLSHFAFPGRSKLSVVARGIPIVFLISCVLLYMMNSSQNLANKELIPLSDLGGVYILGWLAYMLVIIMFKQTKT